ncbi:hypothetical protein QBC36DRAFT_350151 [Triangularia setosa]|uniref:Ubiquitin carboxyl-terminal hydrolase n=1 Tax=Triangularia setosa TaxID=2587417 RepID=A0AAN7A1D7_9PEZI|nr:hypothetical protein QBC36DRAFT_350151 [Podospora setosa]
MPPKRTKRASEPADTRGSTPECVINIEDDAPPLRRSSRMPKKSALFDDIKTNPVPARTPKRKAPRELDESEPELEPEDPELSQHVTNDIIAASLKPWEESELEDWDGWAEVASDPELFTDILRKLGVKDARIEEVLLIDHLSTRFPPPVHGLVFLQEYESMRMVWLENQPDKSTLWFATQTATNACGTIAILNILMNAKDITIGDKLSEFKEQTKNLAPPLRGNKIATNTFIRGTHNMHSSRIELLHAVRALEDEVVKIKKARAAKNAKRTASSGRRRSGGATSTAYHFVAFVPIGNGIWLFDGLDDEPGYICDIEHPENWLEDIESTLHACTMGKGDQYNLLALCGAGQDAGEEEDSSSSRQNQFAPAIHEWVKRLAECGELHGLVDS